MARAIGQPLARTKPAVCTPRRGTAESQVYGLYLQTRNQKPDCSDFSHPLP